MILRKENIKRTAHLARALTNTTLPLVDFDPRNKEHIQAYRMLVEQGKQHPSLRFNVPYPYLTAKAMMQDQICAAYIQQE